MPATPSNGVDLMSCQSYFDGCNTCMVQSGQIVGCTKMMCETLEEPKCLKTIEAAIDLTNCTSYFDGCNNCTVVDGKVSACTLMYCENPTAPKCTSYSTGENANGSVGLANPASVNCEAKWWTLNIVTQSDGSQIGMCALTDGTSCEERAYMRGECGTTTTTGTTTSPANEETPTMCTMEYAPVCASVAVQCIKAPCPAIEQTFGNKCMMNGNKLATFLHDGECATK